MEQDTIKVAEDLAERDVPCVRCGYNLRALSPEGRCPECGLEVGRSLSLGRELRDSRPRWIASLASGAWLLLVSLILPAIVVTLTQAVGVAVRGSKANLPGTLTEEQAEAIVAGSLLLAAMAHLIGVVLLTRAENPHAAQQPLRAPGIVLRICAMGPLLSSLMFAIVAGYELWASQQVRWNFTYAWEIKTLKANMLWPLLLYLPCPLIELWLLRRLAVRVLNRHLIEHTTIVQIGYPLSMLAIAALFLLRYLLDDLPGYFYGLLLVLVSFALFWLWSIYVFGLSGWHFGRAARQAEVAWRAHDGRLPVAL